MAVTVGMAVAAAGGRALAVAPSGTVAPSGAMSASGSVAASGTVSMATVGAMPMPMPMAVSGAMAVGRLGGRRRGLLRRGHRPIIARTSDAHCSPRHICR